jgi:8-oxo-dGTP pyrophosphatase MutT (NUDIX family)
VTDPSSIDPLGALLADYRPQDPAEARDLARLRELAGGDGSPWQRTRPLHTTASALVVHPPSGRVLLRWHQRQQAWLQVGGHGDPGEEDPLGIARREAAEETGLTDLVPWPDPRLRHVVIVAVPAAGADPAHEHTDLRFFLATREPDSVVPERPDAPLRWLSFPEAYELTTEANLRETLNRAERLLPDRA